jgi:hypothetical protein
VKDNTPLGTVLNFPAVLTYTDPSGNVQSVSANVTAQVWSGDVNTDVNGNTINRNTDNNINLDADLCLFVVDGKEGVTNKDYYFAQWLHKLGKKVVLIANKCENFNEEVFGTS